jgi:hypothetical protein
VGGRKEEGGRCPEQEEEHKKYRRAKGLKSSILQLNRTALNKIPVRSGDVHI